MVHYPVLPFLGFLLDQEKPPNLPRIFFPSRPRKPLEKNQRKEPISVQGDSLLTINQGNPNNQGKEGQGRVLQSHSQIHSNHANSGH